MACYDNRSLIVGDTVHEKRKKNKKVRGVGAKKDRDIWMGRERSVCARGRKRNRKKKLIREGQGERLRVGSLSL